MVLIERMRAILEKLLEVFTVFLLLALTCIVLVAVTFRTFGNSLIWYDEIASIGLAWLSFYGANLAAINVLTWVSWPCQQRAWPITYRLVCIQ